MDSSFPVVGIGASAGGLEAVKQFLAGLPADPEMAFVLVMHLSPDRESHLGELLGSATAMPVTTVSEGADLEAGRLYVIQPETDLELEEGSRLVATSRSEREVPAHPIDRLFRSLAREVGDRAVAVVLSGAGGDGAQGIREINRQNGLVLVQDPEEAGFRSMPEAAIEAIRPDLVLSAGELAGRLAGLIAGRPERHLPDRAAELEGQAEQAFARLLARIREQTGHDFRSYKPPTLLRRISRRMQVTGAATLEEYVDQATGQPDEIDLLYEDLLIPVTSFFRDPAVFARLASEVIPPLFEEKGTGDPIRVWVPACSTGEEAYSYAILLNEQARSGGDTSPIQLFATDVNGGAIDRARTGRYPEAIGEDIEQSLLDRYFSKKEDNGYVIQPRIRDQIVFAEHDLLADPPFAQIDLVSCRNLLIYLQPEAQQRILETAHFALRPDGYLVLGSAESAESKSDLFHPESRDLGIYRRRDVQPRPVAFAGWAGGGAHGTDIRTPLDKRADTDLDPAGLHQQLRAEMLASPSVLVDGSYRVVHISAGAERYLKIAEGTLPETILDLATGRLQTAIRTALFTTDQEEEETVRRRIPVGAEEGSEEGERRVTIRIRPVRWEGSKLFHIIFEPEPSDSDETSTTNPTGEKQQTTDTVEQLEAELEETRKQLRATTEQYESANEELRASNEELISMNEELQSTNEELETRKEELESMNEEMQTVNEELAEKVEALREAYGDLENLMAATQIPTLFLNRDLEIRRFTPTTSELFNIRSADEGRPIGDLTTDLEYETLEADARRAYREETVIEREIRCGEERWFLGRVRPYYTVNDEVDGAVLSFIEVTDQKRAEQQLERLNQQLEERVRERTRELEEEITERQRLEREVLRSADEDRYRIGQSLHDGIGQELTGIRMMSRSLANNLEEADLVEPAAKARRIEEAITEADDHARQLAREIVPVDLDEGGLEQALDRFECDMAELHGVAVELDETGDLGDIPEEIATQLFRIVQEAGLNAALHGDAKTLTVRIEPGDEGIRLEVEDDGTGLPGQIEELKQEGMGLRIMQYRAHVLGGHLELEPHEEGGTRLICELPLDPDGG